MEEEEDAAKKEKEKKAADNVHEEEGWTDLRRPQADPYNHDATRRRRAVLCADFVEHEKEGWADPRRSQGGFGLTHKDHEDRRSRTHPR